MSSMVLWITQNDLILPLPQMETDTSMLILAALIVFSLIFKFLWHSEMCILETKKGILQAISINLSGNKTPLYFKLNLTVGKRKFNENSQVNNLSISANHWKCFTFCPLIKTCSSHISFVFCICALWISSNVADIPTELVS